jgi:hypothetical protein
MGNDYKFIPDVWITFKFNNINCIGRTLFDNTGLPIISFIDDNGNTGIIPFFLAIEPKVLKIGIEKINQEISKSLNKELNQQFNKDLNKENIENIPNKFVIPPTPFPIFATKNTGIFIMN